MPTPLPPNPPNRAWGMTPPEEPAPGSIENPIVVDIEKPKSDKPKQKDPISELSSNTETPSPKHAVSKDAAKDVTTDLDRHSPDEDKAATTTDPPRRP